MRKVAYILLLLSMPSFINAQFVQEQKKMDGNNIAAYIINTGIFDQNITINNTPGFEWPKGTGKFAIFTSGLTIGAKVNGQLRMAAASYNGEYRPGYILNGIPQTDSRFHIFSIKRGDTTFTNTDYAEWGNMVPYGAPYVDVNGNGTFELGIDRPGVKDASQTIFICLTDGFPESHTPSEGFGGGTDPLMAEVHFTAWCYDNIGLEDVHFRKWEVVNKSNASWNGALFTIYSDSDIGGATDDWVGCDSTLGISYMYNGDNMDDDGSGVTYGLNPPAAGICFLKTPKNQIGVEYGLQSSTLHFDPNGALPCEGYPNNPVQTYEMMKGLRRDGTTWVNPLNMKKTKFVNSGDPETSLGWNAEDGYIANCNGDTIGPISPQPPRDYKHILNTGDTVYNMQSNESTIIVAAYLAARGSNNLNSVTKLKQLTSTVRNFWQTIGITPISTEIPSSFKLHQNYPNPFNPSTKIRFEIPSSVRGQKSEVRLSIYDIAGKEVAKLVNEELLPGIYEYEFPTAGLQLSSGMYFYRLEAGNFIETKKMVLIK